MVRFDWINSHFLHVQYEGVVTGDELMESSLAISGDSRLDYTHFVMGDWTRLKRSELDQDDVKTLIAILRSVCQITPHAKNATVVKPDASGNAMAAFYKMLADDLPWKFEIFHTYEKAYQWFEQSDLKIHESYYELPKFDRSNLPKDLGRQCRENFKA